MEAPEPNDLNWENLDYNKYKRALRKVFVFLLTLLILVVCSALLVFFSSLKRSTTAAVPEQRTWILGRVDDIDASRTDGCLQLCNLHLYSDRACTQQFDHATD